MLDRIQNTGLDNIEQNRDLEKISSLGVSNPYETSDLKNFFVDESRISNDAMNKYQRELDIKNFSAILKQTDEKEANELVLKNVFNGNFTLANEDVLYNLLNNDNFLNDIFNESY